MEVKLMRDAQVGNYKRYTNEQINKANRIDIVELAKMRGYSIIKKRDELRIPDMGGLVLDKKRNQWFWFAGEKGGGPIQFLMEFEKMNWKEAVEALLNQEGEIHVVNPDRNEKLKKEKKPFMLPEANHSYRHVFAYLVKTRYIHPEIVQEFVNAKLLYEDKRHNCVFIGRDKEGNEKYATMRGTYTDGNPFKGEAFGSNKRYGFSRQGKGKVLFVAEAPIDILSYLSIHKIHNRMELVEDEHLLALGCTADNALEQYLLDHPEVTDIKLGLDNDEAGNDGCAKIYEKFGGKYEIKRIKLREKDMNEVLKKDMQKIIEAKEVIQKELGLEP